MPASMPTATSHFPIKPRQCCHCKRTFLAVPLDAGPGMPKLSDQHGPCWHCFQLPVFANIKPVIEDALKDIRPKLYLHHLRAGIAAG